MKARILLIVLAAMLIISPALSTTITDDRIIINGRPAVTIIIGSSSDTKPTDVPAGTVFLEKDTNALYVFDGTSWSAVSGGGGASKLSELIIDTDLNMQGYNITGTGDIQPNSDNVSIIGSPTARYNAIYVYALYTGDVKFANGWVLTEAENLGLGSGIVLVSPDGKIYEISGVDWKTFLSGMVLGGLIAVVAVLVDRRFLACGRQQ